MTPEQERVRLSSELIDLERRTVAVRSRLQVLGIEAALGRAFAPRVKPDAYMVHGSRRWGRASHAPVAQGTDRGVSTSTVAGSNPAGCSTL